MAFKDVLSIYGRVALIMAAFAFVAGIVAGPLVGRIWSSHLTVTENNNAPLPMAPKAPMEIRAGQPG